MVRYDPYTDSFIDDLVKRTTATINLDAFPMNTVQMVEISDESIEKIADAVVRKLADRKTEPQSGYCNECKWYGDKQVCGRCRSRNLYAPKTEPQTENICDGCVCDDGKHLMYCMNCKGIAVRTEPPKIETEPQIFTWGKEVHEFCKMKCNKSKARSFGDDRFIVCGQLNDAICISLPACPLGKWIAGKEYHILPMDEPQTDCGDFADRLAYERGIKHAWKVAQNLFDSTVTFYEAEAKQFDKDINVRSKDEPQTERSE